MYYTLQITDNAQAIFAYQTLAAATEKFHSEIAYALNQNINCLCMVVDGNGIVHRSEKVGAAA